MNPIENKRQVTRLMLLFMTTYLISYLTRVNYAAVVTEIADAEGILRSVASLALTGSAVTYGVGQLLSGWLGDRIQPRTLVFCGLLTTLLTNLLIPLCGAAYQMTAVWCVNGLAQAFMWPPLVRLMSTLFSQTDYKRACVVVSWGSSLGTILVYLASPLCIRLAGWRSVFFVSAAAAAAMAAVWVRKCPRVVPALPEKPVDMAPTRAFPWSPMLAVVLFCIVLQGSLRDGVTTWLPSLLSDAFGLGNETSILSGVVLPVFGMAAFQLASVVYRRAVHNELTLAGLLFAGGALSVLLLALFHADGAVFSVAAAALLTGCMHGVNLMLICMLPPYYAGYGRISLVSGMFNACTYIGSAASAYGMAAFSESFGWDSTILLWFAVALTGGALCFVFSRQWGKFTRRVVAEKP